MSNLLERAKKIKCLICDVDGVLTDGSLFIDNHGNSLKAFHVHDGMGLKLLLAANIQVAVITTSKLQVIDHRMSQLGIKHYFKDQCEKETAYLELKNTLNLQDDEFAYIGDDLPDLPLIRKVGLGIAVANAVKEVKEFAFWQTEASGGKGAVREVCDLILHAQNKLDDALKKYFTL